MAEQAIEANRITVTKLFQMAGPSLRQYNLARPTLIGPGTCYLVLDECGGLAGLRDQDGKFYEAQEEA